MATMSDNQSALTAEQRFVLEKLLQKVRCWLEDDLSESLSGRFGIHADGRIEHLESLSLSSTELAIRRDLVAVIEYLRAEVGSGESITRLIREAAFSHINRLIAVRIAEAIGLIPETMARGLSSVGFMDFTQLSPTVGSSDWSRFSVFIRICADELAADIPVLFDPRNPLLSLEPTEQVLNRVVDEIVITPDEIWRAPDVLGWAYQFFNSGEERHKMRKDSPAPQDSHELAVRNQFFTPSYVVDFLVQNGLGTYLVAGFPALVDELPLLLEAPVEPTEIDLADIKVLDPACGSGHFLLGAYDILEKAWQLAGVEPAKSAPSIVKSLWGIDIDPRVVQIAQTALLFRARRHCDADLPTLNIICARALPMGQIDEFVEDLDDHVARIVRGIAGELNEAPVLGSLLKVEKRFSSEVSDIFGTGVIEGTLAEGVNPQSSSSVKNKVLDALDSIAVAATATVLQRLFAAQAQDAVRFIDALARRYTAVLMNPPFGEPVPCTKGYLRAAYPWIPTKDYNLLAAFVGRGLELCEPNYGTCGAITSRSGLFIKTFEAWRRHVLLGSRLAVLADLGSRVMEQALVEAACYVLENQTSQGKGSFVRLLKETDRPSALVEVVKKYRSEHDDSRVFKIDLATLEAIPGAPVAYWMDDSIRRLFRDFPQLEGTGSDVRQGLATGDDFQFVRAFWEVDPERIGYSDDQTRRGVRWVPFAKGGEYSPYWSDTYLLIDWERGGERIRNSPNSRPQNMQFFFRPGLTWPRRTNSDIGFRILPAGMIFGDKGPAMVPRSGITPFELLGWLRSRLVQTIMDAMVAAGTEITSSGASRSYEVGLVQQLPWVESSCIGKLGIVARRMAERRASSDASDETTRRFVSLRLDRGKNLDRCLTQLKDGLELDRLVNSGAKLDPAGLAYLDREIGPYPLCYPERTDLDDRIAEFFVASIESVIGELINERGGSRAIANLSFVADRRIEVIAHGLEVSPYSIVRVVKERGLVAHGEAEKSAFRLISYLVGLAFGRWDLRIGRDPVKAGPPADLFSPPARHSPGSLLADDGRPLDSTPPDYLIKLPHGGLLVDQAGHDWDIGKLVERAGEALFDSDGPLRDALEVLMTRPDLAKFLRTQFFNGHLKMYSVSRRKAPIYWQLQVPSKTWGIWLYAPKLSREMLFAIVREAEQRQRLAERHMDRLQREAVSKDTGRRASQVAKEMEIEQNLAVELARFRAEAERIANIGWEPDLDDGMVLNAALLADLFPAWPDAVEYRDELKKGRYEWSTVSQYVIQS